MKDAKRTINIYYTKTINDCRAETLKSYVAYPHINPSFLNNGPVSPAFLYNNQFVVEIYLYIIVYIVWYGQNLPN